MSVNVTRTGPRQIHGILEATKPAALQRVCLEEAEELKKTIWQNMADHKSGRMYGNHQASAPGESPANRLQAYHNSIQTRVEGQTDAAVFTDLKYAPILEFGGRKVAARPMWAPATAKHSLSFKVRMEKHLQDSVK